MKVLVLGIDALEYDLVEEYDLKNLKQKEYGKVDLLLKAHETPFTPALWCSFITGVRPEVHGVGKYRAWDNPLIEKMWVLARTWLIKYKNLRFINFELRETIISILEKIGFGKSYADKNAFLTNREDINCDTIFDDIQDYVAISIPAFNEDPVNRELRKMVVEGPKYRLKQEAWNAFENRKRRLFHALDKERSLVMVHFFVLDVIQHVFFYDKDYIRSAYERVDKLVEELKGRVGQNPFTLIVSDHGQKRGLHTRYGFYSCNENLNLHSPKITDFAAIIRQKLGVPSRHIELVKARLRKLGYI